CQSGLAIDSGLFLYANRPTQTSLVAYLDRARIAQCFLDEKSGDLCCLALRFEVDGFDQGFAAFAFVGLGEAHNCAAQRGDRSGLIVAMLSAEPRCRYQERTQSCDLLVQNSHGGVERFGTYP